MQECEFLLGCIFSCEDRIWDVGQGKPVFLHATFFLVNHDTRICSGILSFENHVFISLLLELLSRVSFDKQIYSSYTMRLENIANAKF